MEFRPGISEEQEEQSFTGVLKQTSRVCWKDFTRILVASELMSSISLTILRLMSSWESLDDIDY